MPVKAVSSKLLAQRWDEDAYKQHVDRMKNVSSTLDMTAPKRYPHLLISLKKLLIEEERQTRYHNENKVLMDKIREIVKGRGTLDRWNDHETKSLNRPYMAKVRERIRKENLLALRRLKGVVSTMTHTQWEGDFKRHLHYKDMLSRTTKDYHQYRLPPLSRAVKASEDSKAATERESPVADTGAYSSPRSENRNQKQRSGARGDEDDDARDASEAAAAGATRRGATEPAKSPESAKESKAPEPIIASHERNENDEQEPKGRAARLEGHVTSDPSASKSDGPRKKPTQKSKKKGQRKPKPAVVATASAEAPSAVQSDSEERTDAAARDRSGAADVYAKPQRREKREPSSGEGFLPPIVDKGGLVSQKSDAAEQ